METEPKAEMSLVRKAVIEAMDRLRDVEDPNELIPFTADKGSADLLKYLEDNKANLLPEELFYLQTTIELRKEEGR